MRAVISLCLSLVSALYILSVTAVSLHANPLTIEADQQYQYAEQLKAEGQYRRAAEEFDRFAFFFPEHPRFRMSRFQSATAFFQAGDNGLALERFTILTRNDLLDKVAIESYFMATECYLAEKQFGQAILQMRNLIVLSDQVQVKDRAYERIGWIHIDQMDWAAARRTFGQMTPSAQKERRIDRLNDALANAGHLPHKTPALAGTLSVIPGAGQIYCGRYEDALAAFLVNGALAWASYESFDNDLNALGGLLAFVGIGFYASNIYSAISSAHKFNFQQEQRYGEQLRREHLRQHHIDHYPPDARRGSGSKTRIALSFQLPF